MQMRHIEKNVMSENIFSSNTFGDLHRGFVS